MTNVVILQTFKNMDTFSTRNLGNYPSNTASIPISGMTFPTSGNYTVQALVDGKIRNATLTGTSGNAVLFANTYPSDATVLVRIKLPVADQTDNNSYLNDPAGHIWFQFTNVPV